MPSLKRLLMTGTAVFLIVAVAWPFVLRPAPAAAEEVTDDQTSSIPPVKGSVGSDGQVTLTSEQTDLTSRPESNEVVNPRFRQPSDPKIYNPNDPAVEPKDLNTTPGAVEPRDLTYRRGGLPSERLDGSIDLPAYGEHKLVEPAPKLLDNQVLEETAKSGAGVALENAISEASKTGVGKSQGSFKGGEDGNGFKVNYEAEAKKGPGGEHSYSYSYSYQQESKEVEYKYEGAQGEQYKVYTQPYSWCTAREELQNKIGDELKDVRISGPKFGFSSISTVELCYPEDFKIGFLTAKNVTSVKLVGADGKSYPLKENTDFQPKPGDPLLRNGASAGSVKSYVFVNSDTKGPDGKYFVNSGSNVFKVVMEGQGVEAKPAELHVNILEPLDESEECVDEKELSSGPGGMPGGPDMPGSVPPGGKTPAPDGKKPAPDGQTPAPDGKKPAPDGQTPAPDGKKPAPDDNKPADDKVATPTVGSCTGGGMGTFLEEC